MDLSAGNVMLDSFLDKQSRTNSKVEYAARFSFVFSMSGVVIR